MRLVWIGSLRRGRERTGAAPSAFARSRDMAPMDTDNGGPRPPSPDNDWASALHVRALVLIGLTAVALFAVYAMARPFMAPLTWALALAVVFLPVHRWVEARLVRPNLAAFASVIGIAVVGVCPVLLLVHSVSGEALEALPAVAALVESGRWRAPLDAYPLTAQLATWIEANVDLPGFIQAVGAWVTGTASELLRGSLVQIGVSLLTFYMLFYFLRDRGIALDALRLHAPLPRREMTRIFADVYNTVHATVYGTVAVALVQGLLGGLMFWALDLPAPILWGAVMGLLGVVPLLGAFLVWIPAALFLLLAGHEVKALLLVLWGAVVVGGIDNLLYPILVGRRMSLHSVVAFISIVGGILLFGPAGLILGPVVFTLARALLRIWNARIATEEAG
jgi:predicted PurR-regulated permease PerM